MLQWTVMATIYPPTSQLQIFPTSLTRRIFRPRAMGRPKGSKDKLSRIKRERQQVPHFKVMPRDREIIAAVALYRRLNMEQLIRLFFTLGSASNCRKRLSLLHHGGYLHRVAV